METRQVTLEELPGFNSEEPPSKRVKSDHDILNAPNSAVKPAAPSSTVPSLSDTPDSHDASAMPAGVIETGQVYFFYRPRVGVEHAGSVDDIQRFFMILSPSTSGGMHRLLIIGKKKLPEVKLHDRFFGFVEATSDSREELVQGLAETGSQSPAMGWRSTEPSRQVGEGTYSIVAVSPRETHLAYRLTVPTEPGQAQRDLNIRQEATYTLTIKNPDTSEPQYLGLNTKAVFSAEQKKQFHGLKWTDCRDPSMLDVKNCEFILIGASTDLTATLGEKEKALDVATREEDQDKAGNSSAPEVDPLAAKMKESQEAQGPVPPAGPAKTGAWE